MQTIEKLVRLPDCVYKPYGYDYKTLPEPTTENMKVLLDKIDELVEAVNKLILEKYNISIDNYTIDI